MLTEQRTFIIETSLKIERNLSLLLANLLVINNIDNSRTLGNKSSGFTFNQKADLLLDTEFISPIDSKKFRFFMEIRNQFAHNRNCQTFIDCAKIVDGFDKRLNGYFPNTNENKSKEEIYKQQITSLINDLHIIVNNCFEKITQNLREYVDAELNSFSWEELKDSLIKNLVSLEKLIDFPVEPDKIKKFKETLFIKIMEDAVSCLKVKTPEILIKMEKKKLKHIE